MQTWTNVQISAIQTFVWVTQREDFAMHLWDTSPWFRQGFHSVQCTVMEWSSQILIALQQHDLLTASYQGPAGRTYALLLKGLRVSTFFAYCAYSPSISAPLSAASPPCCYLSSTLVQPSNFEFQWAWRPCWCPSSLLLLTLSCF